MVSVLNRNNTCKAEYEGSLSLVLPVKGCVCMLSASMGWHLACFFHWMFYMLFAVSVSADLCAASFFNDSIVRMGGG